MEILGTPIQSVMDTEDRELFVRKLDEIQVKTIQSMAVQSVEQALEAARQLGYPVILRAAYALRSGIGICDTDAELRVLAEKAFAYSPQVLVEKA